MIRVRHLAFAALLSLTACHSHAQPSQAEAQADSAAGAAFLAKNAKAPGVVVLPSGLQYKIVHSGPATGVHPAPGDQVKVDYTGSLLSGDVFDSTVKRGEPAVLPLDGLVQGWMEALPMMRPGDHWILYIPSDLGYGPEGRPPVIPPASVLVFDMTLVDVLKPNAAG
jgi:peptidylprolyl isomerase/FKBP-type peptidyl-prolyl cis-trans isomerase FklB